jgi:CubicO group peptidase (beta-lactamase class C family)
MKMSFDLLFTLKRFSLFTIIATSFLIIGCNNPTNEEPEKTKPPLVVENIPAIDDGVSAFMTEYGVKGVSVAVTKHGKLVYAKGYGYANSETKTRVDTTTLFRIASLSKFITAAGIMKLIEEGKLSMDMKVFGPEAIFPEEYGSSNFPKYVQDIRVRDLLHHEIGGWSNSGSYDPAFAKPAFDAEKLIYWTMKNMSLQHEPGTEYSYSNLGYMILGEIIEKVSGDNYEDYIREHILIPSGVSNMQISNDFSSSRQPNEAEYYTSNGPIGYEYSGVIRRLGSAGGWIASSIDLVRVLTHIDGFDSVPDILKSETVKLMSTPSSLPSSDYACGFHINSNSKNWWHSGSLTGTSTWIVRTPSGYTWTILTNTSASNITTGLNRLIWPAVNDASTNWTDSDLF